MADTTELLAEIFKLCREHDAVTLDADKQKIAAEIMEKLRALKEAQENNQ